MISKTAMQKDRLLFQFEGAATSFGEGGGLPPPQAQLRPWR